MSEAVSLRKAGAQDVRFLWQLRNDPVVRSVSLSTKKIPFEAHKEWLRNQLESARSHLWIIARGAKRLGQIRLDHSRLGGYVVNLALIKSARNQGLGARSICLAISKLCKSCQVKSVVAYVKATNEASAQCFRKIGFKRQGIVSQKGKRVIKLVLKIK